MRIVRKEDYAIYMEKEAIIQDAKAKREKLLKQATVQIDLMKESAVTEIAQMREQAEKEIQQYKQQKQIEDVFERVQKRIEYFSALEETFVQMLKTLVQKVLGEIPADDRICLLVKNALQALSDGKTLHIVVHPEQCNVLKSKVKDLQKVVPTMERIEVISNKALNMDDCLLETETGILDASLTVQLDALIKAIEKSLH